MPFQNENQKEVFGKVKDMLLKYFGEKFLTIRKDPNGEDISFQIIRGSTDVQIFVNPYRNTESQVTIMDILVYQLQFTPAVADWVARINNQIMFGGLCLVEYKEKPGWGNVVLYYDMLGKTITQDELINAVENAGFVADKWDDYIVQTFGGLTAQMSWEQQQKGNQPPAPEPEPPKEDWEK